MLVGGIYNAFKSRKGQGLTDNPYQSEMFSSGQVEAFEQMRENGLLTKESIAQLKDLSEAQKKVLELMGEKDIGMEEAIKELGESAQEGGGLLDQFREKGIKAFSAIGSAVANAALSAGLAFLASKIIEFGVAVASYKKTIADAYQEYGRALKEYNKSIGDYKTKITDLNKIIYDENSSIEQVTQAKKDLREIQSQIVDMCGNEAEAIGIVTDAINNQASALDALGKKKYNDLMDDYANKRNQLSGTAGRALFGLWDTANGRKTSNTAQQEIQASIESYTADLGSLFEGIGIEEIRGVFKDFERGVVDNNITGNVDDIISSTEQALKLLENYQVGQNVSREVYDKYERVLNAVLSKAREDRNNSIDLYNMMLQYKLLPEDSEYREASRKVQEAQTKFDKAKSTEQENEAIDSFNKVIQGVSGENKDRILGLFKDLYPVLYAEAEKWEFKVQIKADDGKLKKDIKEKIDAITTAVEHTVTQEELSNWDESVHSQEANTAYGAYTSLIGQYGMGAQTGSEYAAQAGILSTDNIEAFKQSIAPELQKALAGVDQSLLAAVKDVNNLPSKFGQAFKKVSKNVGSETDRINAALRIVAKEATQTAKTTEKELGGMDLSDVAKHLSKLNDVYDKLKKDGKVKWDTIDTKDFKEAFGDIKDETGDFQKAWDNFHKTLSSTPNDTKAVQEAFDVLASAYVYNSECLDMLNENNADLIEGMLSDNGVLNASEVVAYALDQKAAAAERDMVSEQMLTQTGYDLTTMQEGNINVTLEQMAAFLQSEQAANLDKQAIANLVLQQAVLNGSQITTDGSVNALIQLAQAANMTASQIVALNNVMAGGSGGVPAGMSADEWDQVYDKEAYYKSQAEKVWTDFKDAEAPKLKLGGGGGGASSGGGGGGGGGGNKEPSKTDKEFDYVNRYLQILQEQNEELRGKVDNQYVILQDAEDNAAEFSEAIGRLGEAEQELNSLGVYYGEDEFTEFLKTLDLSDTAGTLNENVGEIEDAYKEVSDIYDDTPGLVHPVGYQDGDTFLGAEIEDYDKVITAAKKYKKALSDVEKAKDKTSKTLDENGTGQLTFIKQLQESDKQLIAAYEHAADSYKTEWEDYKDKILEAFKEDGKGEKYIQDIMFGNLDPEEWERMITYDSNDQTMKDNVELLERAQIAYDHNKESLKSMREWQQKLNDDVQKEYEMRLNIVKAEMTEIESRMNEAQHDLDMKEILGEVVQEADYQRLINISEEQVANYEKQLDVLNEQLGTLDEGEQAWYDCKSQIADCEQNIRECVKQQAEWNDTILRMPVENISRFLGLVQNLGQTLKNWLSVNDAKGIAQNAEQIQTSWTTAFDQVADDELGLMKQLEDYEELLENYDLGSTKFSEVDDEIQSARDSVEQLVEEMIELNKQLLTIPIDKLSEMTTYLDGTLSDLQSIQSEYETTINTVIDLITKQQEDLEEEYNELEKSIEDQIKPLQDQLDLLGKQNDQRDRELAIENALFELEKAREQKTVQVIRDGRVQYEVDESAVRNAQQGYDDALYNKLTGDLQDKIDDLNDQLEKARESTDDQVQALEDMKKNRWETIIPDTERARNEEIATQVFTDLFGASNWKELVLAGQDARGVFADEAIYQGMRQSYGTNSEQQRDTQRQIDINNIITESLTRLVEDFQADKINSEQLSAKVSTLMNFVNDGLITGQERLENTLSLGDYSNLGAALTDATRQRDNQMDIFRENLAIAQENRDQVNELITRWDDFKIWYDETYKQLYEQYKKIDFIGDTVAKHYGGGGGDDGGNWESVWTDNEPIYAGQVEVYSSGGGGWDSDFADGDGPGTRFAEGLEVGAVGGMTKSQRFKAIQSLGLKKLDPDEFPAILHLGEGVINRQQQSTMLDNFRQALALGGAGGSSVIQMSFGDITLPSVTNGKDFAESLATQFQPAMNQVFSKIFRR